MKWVKLGELLIEQKETIGARDGKELTLLGVNNRDGIQKSNHPGSADLSRYKLVRNGWFAYNPMRINVGSIGWTTDDLLTGIISPDYVVFSCNERLHPEYLWLFLKSDFGQREICKNTTGSVRERLYFGSLAEIQIPLPPLDAQRTLATKLASIRTEIAKVQKSVEAQKSLDLPQLRQAILELAVQGQLVPQYSNDEPAIDDLQEIESEKQAMIHARNLRPNRISEIEQTRVLQYDIPDSWRWFRLGDVAFFQEGPGIRNWQFRREGVKLLNVQNIVEERLVLENSNRFISIEEFEATYTHFRVEKGDILFASSGGSWGKTAWFEDPGYPVMLNTSMIRLKFYSKRCSDDYLLLFLRGQFFRKQMEIQLVGMQPNFGSTHLGRVYIPLPPLAEQKRIVTKVTELLSLCDALETKLTQAESASTQLLSAAVHHLLHNSPS